MSPGIGALRTAIPFLKGRASTPNGDCSLLTAITYSATRINLAWTNGSTNEDGISIERSTDGITFAEIDTVAAGVSVYADTPLTEATHYYYRVRAYRGPTPLYSAYSNTADDITFVTEVTTYIAGLTTPLSIAQIGLLNTFVAALKSGLSITNLSDAFDVMYILAGETAESSLRNIVKNAHYATAVNSPTFAALEGYTGATGKYLDTNYNPSTQGSRYTLNNCSLGVYSRTDANGLYSDIGSRTGTNDYTAILSRYGGVTYMRLHSATNPVIQDAEANSLGMFIVCRNAASEEGLFGYHNKSALSRLNTGNTNNIPNCNIFIGARNNNGTLEQESIRQLSFACGGRYFSEAEVGVIVDAFETYMDANSKGVLP
jgi:hypothetical protein